MTDPKPMDPKRLADLLEHLSTYPPGARLMLDRDELAELLADRDYQAQRAERAEIEQSAAEHARDVARAALAQGQAAATARVGKLERERDEARDDRDRHSTRATRYEAVLAELPGECWPEYDGALTAVSALVDRARRTDAAEAEVARLRARVQVEAEDVEQAGVTEAQVEAWLAANGWAFMRESGGERLWELGDVGVWVVHDTGIDETERSFIAFVIGRIVNRVHGLHKCGLDILDEMAAIPLEPTP